MKTVFLSLTWLGCSAVCAAAAGETNLLPQTFRYHTVERGDPEAGIKERITLHIRPGRNLTTSIYHSEREDGGEFVKILTGASGELLEASKTVEDRQGEVASCYRIRIEPGMVYAERVRASGLTTVRSRPIEGREVVADAGLLFRLRSFPFGEDRSIRILMVSFSQHFVNMNIRPAGEEVVEVPAGRFDCYRLEAVVDLVIKEIKTTFWISKAEPHYLVKYEGRRGLFLAPVYTTSLVELE